jgi:RNA polymerase sigma-54 factor
MKPALRTTISQTLTLTPQLRQAIRLLQLSAIELEAEITTAIEENPLLEFAEEAESEAPEPTHEGADAQQPEVQVEVLAAEDPPLDFEPEWEDVRSGGDSNPDADATAGASESENLHDHLLWQLHLTPMSDRDRHIGVALIEAIGDDGYLGETLDSIRAGLLPEINATPDEMLTMLHRIQHFDPVGVGTRDLPECLGVQLAVLSPDTPGLTLARRIVSEHLTELAKIGAERLAAQLAQDPDAVREAVELIRSLDPKPGSQVAPPATEYINADCVAWRDQGVWRVAPARGHPALAINRHYESLIAKASRDDASYLRGHLQEARWLIKSLETRADTVLRVARCIARQQAGFLDHGPEAMRPLTLREVAEELGLHESTISRATTRKYLRTPRGTFEFRHFFASGVADGSGGTTSSTAIQAMIRKLIEAEDPRKPLSDARLASDLKAQGVPVARRTVAKYREAMNIPASNERQRLT